MSLGWLSEPAVLPSESKEIPLDPSSNHELAQAVFDKERESRLYGAVITNRHKITTLRNQQKQFIQNQNAAKRDEFIRQKNELRNQQRMQHKINKYESIMHGHSNVVSKEYLVDFAAKGVDVTMEDHQVTLMKVRNDKIDYDLYQDMVIDPNIISNQAHRKLSFADKMNTRLMKRKQCIIDAANRKQHFIAQIKRGNIDGLIYEMKEIQTKHDATIRTKPIFTNKSKKVVKSSSFVHKRIAMEIADKKRKLDDRNDINKSVDNDIERSAKRFKSQSMDKGGGYAAIPPPKDLYPMDKERDNDTKQEADALIESVLMEEKQDRFIPNTIPQMYGHSQYQPIFNANYAYNPYFQYNQYINPYQNMQYQYQYYNPYISQQIHPMAPPNPLNANDTGSTNIKEDNKTT